MNEREPGVDAIDLKQRLKDAATSLAGLSALVPHLLESLDRLATLENDFADQLHREKLAAMQALAYGASHEINNPLANIAARAQSLLVQERDPQRRRSLATINAQAFRAHEMISDLMLFAKPPAPRLVSVNLAAVADHVVAECSEAAAAQGTKLNRVPGDQQPAIIQADEVQVGVALRALCQNALEAVRMGGHVEVAMRVGDGTAQLEVSDNGPGLTAEARKHLFDPFYSGREAGRGLGLGLSKVWRIMQLHGGQVLIDSRPNSGATFTLSFPR